jgi:hypothetical protein
MRQTRAGLTRKLDQLKQRLLHPSDTPRTGANLAMAQKKATKSAAASSAKSKPAAKTAPGKTGAKAAGTSAKAAPKAHGATAAKKKAASSHKRAASKSTMEVVADKTGEVLSEMLTGAVVGAVAGAAQRVKEEPPARDAARNAAAGKRGKAAPAKQKSAAATPREVVGEMLSGAAVGAVTGAAKSVVPAPSRGAKKSAGKK